MPEDQERLIKIEQQQARLQAKANKIRSNIRGAARKADTRRKIILGAAIIEAAQHDGEKAEWLRGVIARLDREADRASFKDWSL